MARAEQLAAGPTGKTRPRGVFSADERPGRATGAISEYEHPTFPIFLGIFHPGIHGYRAPSCLFDHPLQCAISCRSARGSLCAIGPSMIRQEISAPVTLLKVRYEQATAVGLSLQICRIRL
jgi:hypothetical protein